ncbi:MAG: universal stress protein [Nitrososphaerales archaeon]|jgi:nucleotide-binding universal stress UspA family protein
MDLLLVAVDGSPHSAKVVEYASQLARSIPSTILLLNVVQNKQVPSGYTEYARIEGLTVQEHYEQMSQGILDDLGASLKKAGVKHEAISAVGNPAVLIIEIAKRRKASMIVVGVFGLHRFGRIRSLGSVSRRVVENATVPVVLVP